MQQSSYLKPYSEVDRCCFGIAVLQDDILDCFTLVQSSFQIVSICFQGHCHVDRLSDAETNH